MISHKDVARAFIENKVLKGSRMFTKKCNGKVVIYSYGEHFPIAVRTGEKFLYNEDKYSNNTSHHQSYVYNALEGTGQEIIRCNTQTIRSYVENPSEPIVIVKEKEHLTITGVLQNLKNIMKQKGHKSFPIKKLKKQIEEWELMHSI